VDGRSTATLRLDAKGRAAAHRTRMGALRAPSAAAGEPGAALEAHAPHDPGCHPSRLAHGLCVECIARLGAAAQHRLRVVPPLGGRGWLERLHHALLMAVREHQGREASPTLGIVDSQTVKVMAPAGPRGYDAAKKINGRKRHILTDSCGNLLAVRVTDGAVQDRDEGVDLVRHVRALFPWLLSVVADSAYTGRFETALAARHLAVQIVRRPDFAKGFVLLPKRWRVEQAFGTGRFCRRLLVDHETLPHVSEAMIYLGSLMRFVHALTA
jgi:transposase